MSKNTLNEQWMNTNEPSGLSHDAFGMEVSVRQYGNHNNGAISVKPEIEKITLHKNNEWYL